MVMGETSRVWLLKMVLEEGMDLVDDSLFNGRGPGTGEAAEQNGAAAFVTTFLQDAAAGDVSHDIVAIAGKPDGGAGEFALQAERIVNDGFASQADESEAIAEADDLDGIGILPLKCFALVEAGEETLGVAGGEFVGRLEFFLQFGTGGDFGEIEGDIGEPGLQGAVDGLAGGGEGGIDGRGQRLAVEFGEF